ncbi:hypothetical protein D4R75_12635 [bacterium]|nr:MAG: hypothetical protein D4R75_12635 [bacterium]
MIGQTVSHFKILEKLGEGGMGVVYKAQDISLDRTVALKLLPSRTVVTDDDKARFSNEARAAAKLAHPNIATVYLFTSNRNLLRASETMSRQHCSRSLRDVSRKILPSGTGISGSFRLM